ncbi:Nif3-like dinuclear metal center hexameric protein [Halobacteriaceae archaeon GCM10025711]
MQLSELCARYDDELRTADYADLDASANGLQVGPAENEITHVAFAVDGVLETFEAAADVGADALVAHHGISWGGFDRVTDRTYRRIQALVENDLALYVSHLPLDGHQELGNAAGVADLLDLGDREPFGSLGPEYVGTRGRTEEPLSADYLAHRLDTELEPEQGVQTLDFGPDDIQDVAVVTGSGADWLDEAAEESVDALVTGEGKQQLYHEAKEAGVTVFLAGHYATETLGVRALQDLADDWGLETTYFDVPTGL